MSLHHTPWHTLTVTEAWYCVQAGPDTVVRPCRDEDGWCTGHGERAAGLSVEAEHDLAHPADCESRPGHLDCLTADLVCNGEAVLPAVPGVYQVRVRMRLPSSASDGTGASLEFAAPAGGAS